MYIFTVIYHYHEIKLANIIYKRHCLVLSPGDGQWGLWTNWTNCPDLSYAREFRLRFEPRQGLLYDDSGLNAIEMKCENLDHQVTRQVLESL